MCIRDSSFTTYVVTSRMRLGRREKHVFTERETQVDVDAGGDQAYALSTTMLPQCYHNVMLTRETGSHASHDIRLCSTGYWAIESHRPTTAHLQIAERLGQAAQLVAVQVYDPGQPDMTGRLRQTCLLYTSPSPRDS
eukprot:TRINITY_DN18068_c0_g1_i2.p1 TRINITY_DN18068_c0_g1~~TRINITY_DN18068_c0_g1_i2.p1  ORF type:complete len:137 (+),score=4.75 TRINITY_DN18068_c0_g1_i2:118-528(+)